MRNLLTCIFSFVLIIPIRAQGELYLDKALDFIRQHQAEWGLQVADILDLQVSNAYQSNFKKASHIYFHQRYGGVPIHNAISSVHLDKDGNPFFATNRFILDISNKVNSLSPSVSPSQAVQSVAAHLGIASFVPVQKSFSRENNLYVFDKGDVSRVDIPVRLKYYHHEETDQLWLVWDVELDQLDGEDYWSIRVDALDGKVVDVSSFTVKCYVPPGSYHSHDVTCIDRSSVISSKEVKLAGFSKMESPAMNNDIRATYHVFAYPIESPSHGARTFVQDQMNETASPFGWHDTNGQPGAEHTVTRGNNVNAWPARDNQNSANNQPNGGPNLIFDFPYRPDLEPEESLDFATVQLFYFNNVMHDIAYAYGFDEVSGNFQQNNYGRGGLANDHVIARAQQGANTGSVNNANFSTPADGGNGRMNMFVWNVNDSGLLRVLEPQEIARKYDTGFADFGPRIGTTPTIGKVVIARDGTGQPNLGCESLVNPESIQGNIAMVDRGSCFFIQKTTRAQAAGAIGLIICNFENSILNMAAGGNFPNPDIPTVLLSSGDCAAIRRIIDEGGEVIVSLVSENTSGPRQIDGTIDNGIIAHEYGHGISNRLTGGPAAAGCLNNDEQMGEGWSDYFTLVTAVRPGDNGETPRGVGTFVMSQPNQGRGIRRFPYSTDMSINPLTYDDIIGTTAPHPLGEVWVAMLWDLYWAMVDKYGFDDDIIHGDGGNNRAIRLVMDGMRLQACSPGFVDGRNAIIAADLMNYNGENECLIWEVFARRGLGFDANQGSANNRNDGTEGYAIKPVCYNQLRVHKSMTESIEAGQEIDVTLRIENYKDSESTGITVTDLIPEGTIYKEGSANIPVVQSGDALIFNIERLNPVEVRSIRYTLISSENKGSKRLFFEDFERPDADLDYDLEIFKGNDVWTIAEDLPYQGSKSMVVYEAGEKDLSFFNFIEAQVAGENPIFRFFHDYDTQRGFDAGTVEFSSNGGATWVNANPYLFKNPFTGKVDYSTFTLPNIRGFSGRSNGFIQTFADLSEFRNTDFKFKFRFGANATGPSRNIPWSVDNIEILDAFFYDSEVCVTSNEGDTYCTTAENRGTLVEAGDFVSSTAFQTTAMDLSVFPNPNFGKLNLLFRNLAQGNLEIDLFSLEGKPVYHNRFNGVSGSMNLQIDMEHLQNGVYLLRTQSAEGIRIEKIILRR